MTELEFWKKELLEKVRWVIILRNLTVGLVVFLWLVEALATRTFVLTIPGIILPVVVLTYNVLGWLILKRYKEKLTTNQMILLAFGQLLADTFAITFLVHSTGGSLSPFTLMYFFCIIIISIISPESPFLARSLAIFVVILYETILFLEFLGIIPRTMILNKEPWIYQNFSQHLYYFFIFPAFTIIATFLSSNITVLLTKGKTTLKQQIAELNKIRKFLEGALSELDKKTTEISIFYEINARNVFPLEYFAERLSEIIGADTIEIQSIDNHNQIKTLIAHGFPAPESSTTTLEIPLRFQGKNIGKIKLARFSKKEFNVDEKRILMVIAERLSEALEHQRMEEERCILEKQLKEKLKELESFHNLAVGRELKMIELEKEVNALLAELGRPARYTT